MIRRGRLSVVTVLLVLAGTMAAPANAQETLRVGADVGFAPHVMAKPEGGYEGFNVDLIEAVAKRMGVKVEIVNVPYSGIFAAMDAGTINFIIAPTTANADRSSKVLLSEGYLNNDYRFIVKAGGLAIKTLADLRGKTVSVNRGNSNDVWLTERQAEYGFNIARFGSNPDALQAVISGQADANLSGSTVATWIVRQSPALQASLVVHTGFTYSHPFRKGDAVLRDRFERALECTKLDGTVAKIYEKWFGEKPPADEAALRVVVGSGEPGLEGYDPTPHPPACP
jgi:polar amino acid transport system substrate-binding protein